MVPKGLYEWDDESNSEKFAEFAVPSTEELKSMELWCHRHPIILKAGRITIQDPIGMSDEDKDAYLAAQAEADPTCDKYRALNEDGSIMGLESAWITKIVGDQQPYN